MVVRPGDGGETTKERLWDLGIALYVSLPINRTIPSMVYVMNSVSSSKLDPRIGKAQRNLEWALAPGLV